MPIFRLPSLATERLLRRLDFATDGYARDYLCLDGGWRDHVLTALVNDRWEPPT